MLIRMCRGEVLFMHNFIRCDGDLQCVQQLSTDGDDCWKRECGELDSNEDTQLNLYLKA